MASGHFFQMTENRYNRLLIVLLCLAIAAAFPSSYQLVKGIVLILCLLVMLAIVHQIAPARKVMHFYKGLVLGSLVLLALDMSGLFANPSLYYGQIVTQLMMGITLGFPIIPIQKEIFWTEKVTADTLKGAIAAYVLIGITWATLYSVLYELNLAAFQGISADQPTDFLHFSFSTLTTVGYGDIVPVTAFARLAADLESIIGIMYPAILIARLVSLYKTESQESP